MGSSIPRDDNDIPAAGGQLPSGLLQAMQLDATGNLKTSSTAGGTSNVDVIDRIARLLGHVIIDSLPAPVETPVNLNQVNGTGLSVGNPLPVSSVASTTPVLNLLSASQALPYTSANLPVASLKELAIGINFTAFTGGASPSVTFFVDELGLDGIFYQIYTSAALTAATAIATSIGAGLAVNQAFGSTIRLRAVGGGTVAPTSVAFSASIIGK